MYVNTLYILFKFQNFEAFLTILSLTFFIILLFFTSFTSFFIISTIGFILLIILIAVLALPLEIKPFIEMGDTKKYGEIIVYSLYLSGLVIGVYPLLSVMNQIDINNLPISQMSYQIIANQTFGNIISILKRTVSSSLNEITIGSISSIMILFYIFFIFVSMAVAIVIALHYRINQKKTEEIERLESMLSYINFSQSENPVNSNRNQYLLSQYENILTLHEWPIKKRFVLQLLISMLFLFISHLF